MERIAPDKMEEWLFMLDAPLPGEEKRATPAMVEDEGQGFMALMGQAAG